MKFPHSSPWPCHLLEFQHLSAHRSYTTSSPACLMMVQRTHNLQKTWRNKSGAGAGWIMNLGISCVTLTRVLFNIYVAVYPQQANDYLSIYFKKKLSKHSIFVRLENFVTSWSEIPCYSLRSKLQDILAKI